MAKWPKGISQKFNAAIRAALVPIFEERGFEIGPWPGSDGAWNQYAHQTSLVRFLGRDVDLVDIHVFACQYELFVQIEAGRVTQYDGDKASLVELVALPLNQRWYLPSRSWFGFKNDFKLGPPWPDDPDKAIADIISLMIRRLPSLFDYLKRDRSLS